MLGRVSALAIAVPGSSPKVGLKGRRRWSIRASAKGQLPGGGRGLGLIISPLVAGYTVTQH